MLFGYYILDKSHKQWIRIKNCSRVFRMKLNSHIPTTGGYFNNLDQTAIGIYTRTQHSCSLELSTTSGEAQSERPFCGSELQNRLYKFLINIICYLISPIRVWVGESRDLLI